MANHHEIDDLFRERFEGTKDHSVDPSTQWQKFESKLDSGAFAQSALQTSGTFAGASSWGIAASVAIIMGVAGFVSQDRTEVKVGALSKATNQTHPASTPVRESYDQAETALATPKESSSNAASFALNENAEGRAIDQKSTQNTVATKHTSEQLGSLSQSFSPPAESLHDLEISPTIAESESTNQRGRLAVFKMPLLERGPTVASVEERDLPSADLGKVFRKHVAYVRAGVRTGNGESNSMSDPAEWRLNAVASIGYAFAFSPKTFISAEIGWLRRSGNGIERSKDVDLEPLANVLITNFGSSTQEELEIRRSFMNVRESFVAQRLDYVHIPINLHVNLTAHSNASVGTFVDYLVGVENESYMVYNHMDYIKTDFGENDKATMDGLSRWRLGLMAGYEQSISQHVTLDFRAMLPITTVFDRSSPFYQHSEPNQLVDLQLGLNYKI